MNKSTQMNSASKIKEKMHKEACQRLKIMDVDSEIYLKYKKDKIITVESSFYSFYNEKFEASKGLLSYVRSIEEKYNIHVYYIIRKVYCDGTDINYFTVYYFLYVEENDEKYEKIKQDMKDKKQVPV